MHNTLRDREIVLAGGSGGLGSAATELLSTEGARLIVSYRSNFERAEKLSAFARIIQADLGLPEDRRRLLDSAKSIYGLVVFTGFAARAAAEEKLGEVMKKSHEENYLGPVLLAREAAARMRAGAIPGSIVLVSTMQAAALFPGSTAYAAQKAALLHAGRILAKECRGASNIRVNVICPGVTNAGMAQASIASGKYDKYLNDGVVSRWGHAVDIARTVRFFLEPDNYITGQVLTVDGGLTL
jgi:NAD(P)-dependent dehydrogenase (short-subunit alcohol dehydrogenase family)